MKRTCVLKLVSLWIFGFGSWGALGEESECSGQQCPDASNSDTNVLLQFKARVDQMDLADDSSRGTEDALSRSTALDAQFLMHATFGPTRESLKHLGSMSYKEWIKQQIDLPMSSHREEYRSSVNPAFDTNIKSGYFSEVTPCSKGSRWVGHVFKKSDVGKWVRVRDGNIEIAGKVVSAINTFEEPPVCNDEIEPWMKKKGRTCKGWALGKKTCRWQTWKDNKYCQQTCWDNNDPYEGDDCSGGWAQYASKRWGRTLCKLEEPSVGGQVLFGDKTCKKDLFYMTNPAVFVSDPEGATQTPSGSFETNPAFPSLIFLSEASELCTLSADKPVKYDGKYYLFEPRATLLENTPDKPDTSNPTSCTYRNIFNEESCVLIPNSTGACYATCGSPGEVSSVPAKGHQYSMVTKFLNPNKKPTFYADRVLDSSNQAQGKSKQTVWTMMALQADDQLRQRMAWALSQILVVGVPGLGSSEAGNEMWMSYYDIFVRHAFGNYRDILMKVTYSPMMGQYLSYTGSSSYDRSRTYPDENYAREIMQLFSIGVDLLHPNGTVVKDDEGVEVPAYTNENIMNFARVFTGFRNMPFRGNIEQDRPNLNRLDPMSMVAPWHDIYPKPALDGNFLGDGYPLCKDLPKQCFLATGARYDFVGFDSKTNKVFVELEEGSSLLSVLTDFKPTVILEDTLACFGKECSVQTLNIIKVGTGFYEYIAPICVHHFFYNGKSIAAKNWKKMECVDPAIPVAGFACSKGCTDIMPKKPAKQGITCENANETWTQKVWNPETKKKEVVPKMFYWLCNKNKNWRKHKLCAYTCAKNSPEWDNKLAYEDVDCSAGLYQQEVQCGSTLEQINFATAQAHCQSLGMPVLGDMRLTKCTAGEMKRWTDVACDTKITVHGDGKVSAHTKYAEPNKFAVHWIGGGVPAKGEYTTFVNVSKVFTDLPSKDELLAKLKIGAFRPEGECTQPYCGGDVKAYAGENGIDVDTVFEADGKFFKNAQSVVHVGNFSFRNPPVFIRPGPAASDNSVGAVRRAAEAEVASLVDHIAHHQNTPVNIGLKLIQRFTTSNPSAAYIEAVANAFKTGTYGDMKFSEKWGDLAATVAAVLLHPEARTQSKAKDGLLREPMLKLIHVMRSMEYEDWKQEPIVLRKIQEEIGQFPYYSATVFNFFNADYMPPGLSNSMRGHPEPEPEPEPYGPEFQIFTPPFAVNLLNGFTSLIEHGLSACYSGLGQNDDLPGCQRGALNYSSEIESDTVNELDVLLTGGRLTPQDTELVKAAYDKAEDGKKIQAAQTAILLTPEFNNLGNTQVNGTRAAENKTTNKTSLEPYKAVVLVFFAGGADTYQMLVPRDCALHDSYKKVRKGIEIGIGDLLAIPSATQKCAEFGVNKNMPRLRQMYLDKEAAFVSNIGSLVEPVVADAIKGGAMKQCPSQFSHSHAQAAAQTMQCALSGKSPQGTGGLMADELAKKNMNVASFSVDGVSTWSQAQKITMDILDKNTGAKRFKDYSIWHDVISNISNQSHSNVYCDNYAEAFGHALQSSETLGNHLDGIKSDTLDNYKAETVLAKQLHQVARVIATRKNRSAERDFFFVQLGGWDTHANIKTVLPGKLKEVDDAIADFVEELKVQKVFNNTVLVTKSDFGRTLSFNGQGTDHGWGGNHIIVGGKVKGGEVYNEFLETYELGGAYDAGRGRSIPKYPWESMMVPIAEWVGVDDLDALFPNLGNFNRSTHIISRSALFDES